MDRTNQNLRTRDDHDVAYPLGRSPVVQGQPVAGHSSGSTDHAPALGGCSVMCSADGGDGRNVFNHDGAERDEAVGGISLTGKAPHECTSHGSDGFHRSPPR